MIDHETGEVMTVVPGTEYGAKLAAKIARCYDDIEAVSKGEKNAQQGWKFASVEAIYAEVRKVMSKHGLAMFPTMRGYTETALHKDDGTRKGGYVLVDYDFTIMDAETGASVTCQWRGEVMEYGDKAFNKTATAATKSFLRTLFMIPTDKDEDPDSTAHTDRPGGASRPTARPPRAVSSDLDEAVKYLKTLVQDPGADLSAKVVDVALRARGAKDKDDFKAIREQAGVRITKHDSDGSWHYVRPVREDGE